MYKGKTIIALIPARGGSKGLPGKNIIPLLEKPLIAWTIDAAKESRFIDRVIVSTDDNKIAGIAKRYGAEVPFRRPKALATDKAKGIDVVMHAVGWLEDNGEEADILVLLQPTSPLRTASDIDEAIRMLFDKKAYAVVSVSESEHHPYWAGTLPPSGCMKDFRRKKRYANRNRQDLPVFYRQNGAIYIACTNRLMKDKDFLGSATYAYIMPKERSIDIDDKFDLAIAEYIMKEKGDRR